MCSSDLARGRVSKAAEWRGLAIENTRIQEALRAPNPSSSSLPMAAPESRSGRITRSMATARVAASELLARALAATAINGDPSYHMRKPWLAHRGSNGKWQFGRSVALSCGITHSQPRGSQRACTACEKANWIQVGIQDKDKPRWVHTTQGPTSDQRLHAVRLG